MQREKPTETGKVQMAYDLRESIKELRDRGLVVAAKWCSELLVSLPDKTRSTQNISFSPPVQPRPLRSPGPRQSMGEFLPSPGPGAFRDTSMVAGDSNAAAGPSQTRTRLGVSYYEDESHLDEDVFQLARGYFDMKEFERVGHVLKSAASPRAKFLRIYSAYLAADRRAQESLPHFLDTKEERAALYPSLNPLIAELEGEDDPYLLYLRGTLYARIDQRLAAVECYLRSIQAKPYNWSAWSQLGQLVKSTDMLMDLKDRIQNSVMLLFFAISVMIDLHTAVALLMQMIDDLLEIFPTNIHLKSQKALVYYHMRDFDTAEKCFDEVQKQDPFRMEDIDIFSNMLYVMDKKVKLAKLAHDYSELDRNRAETCCLVGNYYSSRGDHPKAITYFKRSLMLNREYLPAWTLMGHEYVELKNSHAAIEAYRKAVDVNPKDYRAWYGLGQAYELLDMPSYAIEYFNHATALRPYDCRMWTALAVMYENIMDSANVALCYQRALPGADAVQTPNILLKLAGVYQSIAKDKNHDYSDEAVDCHRKIIALGERDNKPAHTMAASYLAVAEYEMYAPLAPGTTPAWPARRQRPSIMNRPPGRVSSGRDLTLAIQYLQKVARSNAPQRDKAEDLLRLANAEESERLLYGR